MTEPRLAIGLPVRNGERYLRRAAESLLSQSFDDFRLLIADNASTDATPEICRELAERDPRVSCIRHPENIGAAPNFNFVFRHTRSEYFKWAAHDDLCAPGFLAACIQRLDAEPDAAICHSYSNWIDAAGAIMWPAQRDSEVTGRSASRRFIAALRLAYPVVIWGVMRRDAARATGLIGSFVGSDRYFLAELLLRGRAELVPEELFEVRFHDQAFTGTYYQLSHRARQQWFDPKVGLHGLSEMATTSARLMRCLATSPITLRDRLACSAFLARRAAGFLRHRTTEAAAMAIGDHTRRRDPTRPARPHARPDDLREAAPQPSPLATATGDSRREPHPEEHLPTPGR